MNRPDIGRILLAMTLMVAVHTGVAQTITVVSQSTHEPVEEMAVFHPTKFSGLTDNRGKIRIRGLDDTDTVSFQHPAYHNLQLTIGEIKEQRNRIYLVERIVIIGGKVSAPRRTSESGGEVINQVAVITAQDVAFDNPQTTADMLSGSGNVYVQKSQMGGGSPVLRGFEANKVLLVVDGIRMNNAIYRSGHLQNAITLDNAILERTEVVFGPGSVIYGSDALGGVMHFYTRNPKLSTTDSINTRTGFFVRYGSANNERSGHLDLNMGGKKLGFLTSLTYSDFDDLRIGAQNNKDYPGFGLRNSYVITEDGRDSLVQNKNKNIMRFSGYDQVDVMQKIRYRPGDKLDILVNLQYSSTSQVPRYDRLNDEVNGVPKYAEWSYGPQTRLLGALDITMSNRTGIFNEARFILSGQRIDEDRKTRRYLSPIQTNRKEDVFVYSLNADMSKEFSEVHSLQYGVEGTYQHVNSLAYIEDINTQNRLNTSTRYPDGGSVMQTYAAYVFQKFTLSKGVVFSQGIRYSNISLTSHFDDTTFFNLPFDEISLFTSSLSGSGGLTIDIKEKWSIKALGSTGFRSPNVDDVAKVFDSSPGNVIVPNNNLRSEQAYNAEIGLAYTLKERLQISVTGFYTFLTDAIVRRDFTFNGQDSIIYEGVLSNVQANVNAGKAVVYGTSLILLADMSEHLSLKSTFNYTVGEDISNNVPLGHIPPVYGQTGILYRHNKVKATLYARYNGWKRLKDYSPFNEDKLDEATPDGTPAWMTLNARVAYQLNEIFRIQVGLENMMDKHYKPFASGISAPGRHLSLTIRGNI